MPGESAHDAFTSTRAHEVLIRACDVFGFSNAGAELLRLGENAIFKLRDVPVVLRVGRTEERLPFVRRELCVARWLDSSGVSVAKPYEAVEQPIVVEGHPVSVWGLVERRGAVPGVADLARLLRSVHSAPDGPCDVAPLDPLVHVNGRVHRVATLSDADKKLLLDRRAELAELYAALTFALTPGFVHGDAHTGNLLGDEGQAVLTDFEMSALGPREWDLIPVAVARARFGLSEADFEIFVREYGFDVTTWPGFGVLRDIRELTMTTWLAQNIGESDAIAAEVALRIESIRDGDTSREWHAF